MRKVHVLTWWIYAIALSLSVVRQHSIIFSLSIIAISVLVALRWRSDSPWSKALTISAWLAIFTITFRMLIATFIGVGYGPQPLFTLPKLTLPSWMAGVVIGGPVSADRLLAALNSAMVLAAVIILIGCAQTLSTPRRVIRALPTPFYDFALVIVIATSLVPQFVISVARIRRAFHMRGVRQPSLVQLATPVIEDSLDRTLTIAGSMDARGFGLSRKRTTFAREKWGLADLLLLLPCLVLVIFI